MIEYTEKDYTNEFQDCVFFYGGWLSNWAPTRFRDNNGIEYNCSEQYMMRHKALLFNDQESVEKIMKADHPATQKQIGRRVKGFIQEEWEMISKKVVYQACYYKFTQNPEALEYLISTKGKLLVEASPTDCIWGIGLDEFDPLVSDRSNWKGTNWLGQVLTQLREDLILKEKK